MRLDLEILEKINSDIEIVVKKYQNYSVEDLINLFKINESAKNSLNALTKRMMFYSNAFSLLNNKDELCLKTIKLDKYGKLKEAMSFPAFKYTEVVKESWENSSLRRLFKERTYIFAIYKNIDKQLFLHKIVMWEMPEKVLEVGVRPVWDKMQQCLKNGEIVKYIDDYGRYCSYFPSATDNAYVHVRPHAQNRNDTYPLPVADKLTGLVQYPKHCFWLNRAYILKIISRDE